MATKYKSAISDKKKEAHRLMSDAQLTKCNIAIHAAAVASGAAGAIPIPVADAIPITAAQIAMVLALGNLFDQKIIESAAKGLISATASAYIGRNLVKFIPIFGWGISAAVAAGITEAVGWTVAVDFAKNAKKTWEVDFNSNDSSNNETTSSPSDSKENKDTDANIAMDLEKRAASFLNGEKNLLENSDEYDTIILDFERYFNEYNIDEYNPLRKMYDDLCVHGV